VVLSRLDVPERDHLEKPGAFHRSQVLRLRRVFGHVVQLPSVRIQLAQAVLGQHHLAEKRARFFE